MAYLGDLESGKFIPKHVALILNESFSGCAILIALDTSLKAGDKVNVKVGKLKPASAEIAWVKKLAEDAFKMGLNYIE